jgi:hypothetical protein
MDQIIECASSLDSSVMFAVYASGDLVLYRNGIDVELIEVGDRFQALRLGWAWLRANR